MASSSMPSTAAVVAAASVLATLKRPPSGDPTAARPRHVSSWWSAVTTRSAASASEYGTISIGAASSSSRPWASSTLTTPTAASSGVNRRALARKYSSTVPCRSRWSLPEVGEHGGGEAGAVDAVQRQGVRRHLHHDGAVAARRGRRRGGPAARAPRASCARPTACRSPSVGRPGGAQDRRRAGAVVVVLPFVPVTPTTVSAAARVAVHGRGDRPHRQRGCRRRRAGRPPTSASSWSTSSAVAPAATAAGGEAVPVVVRRRGRRRTGCPAATWRESWVMSVTVVAGVADDASRERAGGSAASRSASARRRRRSPRSAARPVTPDSPSSRAAG